MNDLPCFRKHLCPGVLSETVGRYFNVIISIYSMYFVWIDYFTGTDEKELIM